MQTQQNRENVKWMRVASMRELSERGTGQDVIATSFKNKAIKFAYGKLRFGDHEEDLEGFCYVHDGKVYAFENRCAHMGIELDMDDSDFFTNDGESIQCKVHGAKFHADSGLCYRGPCKGKMLQEIQVRVVEDDVYVLKTTG